MKKSTAVKGFTAVAVLVFSIIRFDLVGLFYGSIVPASSMQGQEVWLILLLIALHYTVLILLSIRFILQIVRRIQTMKRG